MHYFSLSILWKDFLSLSTMTDSFTGYSSLDKHLWSCRTLANLFKGFNVSIEKSNVIVICFPFYVSSGLLLLSLNTLCSVWLVF